MINNIAVEYWINVPDIEVGPEWKLAYEVAVDEGYKISTVF